MTLEELSKKNGGPDLASSLIGNKKPMSKNRYSNESQASNRHQSNRTQTDVQAPMPNFIIPNHKYVQNQGGLPPTKKLKTINNMIPKNVAPRSLTSANKMHNTIKHKDEINGRKSSCERQQAF